MMLQEKEPPGRFSELDLDIHYEGPGEEILAGFVLPLLQIATSYDRVTSFFSINSLLAIAQGLESLWRRRGKMRLILGIHDVPRELAHAAAEELPELVVEAVRRRLLDHVSSLRDELSRDRLATLGWMMQDELLQVRVAAPISTHSTAVDGVFHSKRFVFRDAEGEIVTAVGSPNETLFGLGSNFEEIDVHMSWQDSLGYVARHATSFERIWDGSHEDLRVVELDRSFATELLSNLGDPLRPDRQIQAAHRSPAEQLLSVARRSPAWAPLNLTTAGLYPHQERVFLDALGRWPIRVLLADEVGLGKTLEAGSIIAFAIRFLGVRRVAVLAPAGLIRQWQDEMKLHFGLDFWRYESGSRSFLSPTGVVQRVPVGLGPLGAHSPDQVLISSQLARGSRGGGHLFEGATSFPEMMVVDEAHAARIRVDTDGVSRPTLMWRLLDDVKGTIPHFVFVSATPMQLQPSEYHSMLQLLGLPEWWAEPSRLTEMLDVLSSPTTTPELQAVKDALSGIASTLREMKPDPARLGASSEEVELLERVTQGNDAGVRDIVAAQNRWRGTYALLVRTHPGHLLTIRNTRSALLKLGYSFPERRFAAPELSIDGPVADFYSMADVYLESAFGRVEAALHPDKARSLGFMKSTYRQRLASSLRAAELSLGRRISRIEDILRGTPAAVTPNGDGIPNEDEIDLDLEEVELAVTELSAATAVEHACHVELGYLHDLLRQLEDLDVEDLGRDPKLETLMDVVGQHLAGGDQLLVFSRYTDTVDACVELFLERHIGGEPPAHAKYTGSASWIDSGDGPLPVSKEDIRSALEEGDVRLVFCSDAASEGLNLQAARVIVNVDVPWNPARLEQRIGRIARLGQRAKEVDIYNLWYPDSVEAKIYERLLARRDLYELAVGEFPEIVGSAIRNELSSRYSSGAAAIADDPIQLLQGLRENQQRLAIQRIWSVELSDRPESQRFRERLADLIRRAASGESLVPFSVVAGDSNVLSLLHPVLETLSRAGTRDTANRRPISVVLNGSVPFGFVLEEGTNFVVIPADELPTVLAWLVFGDEAEAPQAWPRVPRESLGRLFDAIARSSRWLPKSEDLTCVVPGLDKAEAVVDPRRNERDISIVPLHEVRV